MVQANYNPFQKKEIVETEHGIISYTNRRYFAHRNPNQFFRKYGGFGISVSEIDICHNERVDHIIIKYHGKLGAKFYRIDMKYIKYMDTHDNDGDLQVILPIKDMDLVGEESR